MRSLPCSWQNYVRRFICAFFADARIYLKVIGDRSRGPIDVANDGGTAPGPRVKRVLSFDLIKNVRFTSTCALMHMFFGRRGYSFFLAQQFDQRREVV